MNRINWLINRLRIMSVPEIMFRTRRSLTQHLENGRLIAGWQPKPNDLVKPKTLLFGNNAELIGEWKQFYQLDHPRLEEYLAGQIDFFGHEPVNIGNPAAWHRDPLTGINAPYTFGKALNYRDDRKVGNVKFTWEMGRHQHLVPLAVAYAVSGDLRYRQAVSEQIDGWIEQNPYGLGIHWCSALEVSLRLISWALVHSLLALRDSEQGLLAVVSDSRKLGNSIYQHAWFIRHFLSRYSSANNHLIGELTGLWVACQVFDLGEKGKEWSSFTYDELENESRLQVHDDGVSKEQALYYHLWVLEYFLLVWLISIRNGQRFSEKFTERILSMTKFLENISPEGGQPPQIGDADDGFVARFEPAWPKGPYREVLDAVNSVFGDANGSSSQKAFWYQAIAVCRKNDRPRYDWQRSYPITYPRGGYVIMGGADCHLVFDAGPLGFLGTAAHGHADALSFCLAIDGEWWLIDPGTYAYHSGAEWRSYFRGTAAHNTIRINQEDQSQIGGPFLWLKKANAWIENSSVNENIQYVIAYHDGYKHLGITHRRKLWFSSVDHELKILDKLEGAGGNTELAEIYYHFAPDVDIHEGPVENSWIATRKGRKKRLVIYTEPPWSYEVTKGRINPISGWYSPALEEKVPTNTLRGKAKWSSSLKSVTRIVIE